MFYAKNVPTWERVARVMTGLAMAAGGIFGLHANGPGIGLIVMGAMAAATGFIGFCPACALVGRKLK